MTKRPATPLPPAFDAAIYLAANPDLGALDPATAATHYQAEGRAAGRVASPAARREGLLERIGDAASILEIGPFCQPLLRGPHVEYLDVLSAGQLRERARHIGIDPADCPEIIHHVGDLAQVDRRYAAVVSSHAIEHQPDLIRHLQLVARILQADGAFFLLIPDKRFCFDHFIAESTIAGVLQAHHDQRRVHTLASVIEHAALSTHNDSGRHWQGDSVDPNAHRLVERVRHALDSHRRSSGGYIDVHAWYFTPDSFRTIVDTLASLELIDLEVAEVYDSVAGRNEFAAVLRLNTAAAARARNAPIAAVEPSPAPPALMSAEVPPPRLDLAAKAIAAWHGRQDRSLPPPHLVSLADALDAGDAPRVAAMLSALGSHPAGRGILGGAQQHSRAREPIFAARRARETADALTALMEAVGAPSPDWTAIGGAIGLDPAPFPHIGGQLGLDAGNGQVVHLRMIEALHAAYRLRQLSADDDRIVEIGGGAGLTVWYARRLGLSAMQTVDRPILTAIQTYVLEGSGAIEFAALQGAADVLFNHETWPADIDFAVTLARLNPRRILLLRYPADAANAMATVAQAAGYSLVHRHPDWLRTGHQELLFERRSRF